MRVGSENTILPHAVVDDAIVVAIVGDGAPADHYRIKSVDRRCRHGHDGSCKDAHWSEEHGETEGGMLGESWMMG